MADNYRTDRCGCWCTRERTLIRLPRQENDDHRKRRHLSCRCPWMRLCQERGNACCDEDTDWICDWYYFICSSNVYSGNFSNQEARGTRYAESTDDYHRHFSFL